MASSVPPLAKQPKIASVSLFVRPSLSLSVFVRPFVWSSVCSSVRCACGMRRGRRKWTKKNSRRDCLPLFLFRLLRFIPPLLPSAYPAQVLLHSGRINPRLLCGDHVWVHCRGCICPLVIISYKTSVAHTDRPTDWRRFLYSAQMRPKVKNNIFRCIHIIQMYRLSWSEI